MKIGKRFWKNVRKSTYEKQAFKGERDTAVFQTSDGEDYFYVEVKEDEDE